jgi:hypothetical protein
MGAVYAREAAPPQMSGGTLRARDDAAPGGTASGGVKAASATAGAKAAGVAARTAGVVLAVIAKRRQTRGRRGGRFKWEKLRGAALVSFKSTHRGAAGPAAPTGAAGAGSSGADADAAPAAVCAGADVGPVGGDGPTRRGTAAVSAGTSAPAAAAGAGRPYADVAADGIDPGMVLVQDSPIGGVGLFAATDIPANTIVTEYKGDVKYRTDVAKGRKAAHVVRLHGHPWAIDGGPLAAAIRDFGGHGYWVPPTYRAGVGALANADGVRPNVKLTLLRVRGRSPEEESILTPRAFLMTKKDVKAGDELLWRYKYNHGFVRKLKRKRELTLLVGGGPHPRHVDGGAGRAGGAGSGGSCVAGSRVSGGAGRTRVAVSGDDGGGRVDKRRRL